MTQPGTYRITLEGGRYMGTMARLALLLLLIALASGCAKRTLVALAPDPDGKTGSITFGNEAGSVSSTLRIRRPTSGMPTCGQPRQ